MPSRACRTRVARRLAFLGLALLGPKLAFASAGGWQCWADASKRYNIPVDLLYAIARVETGNKSNLVSPKNKNGTYDIGLMQINSIHLPRLKKMDITKDTLLSDPCVNLHVGAFILSEFITQYGYTWQAIDAYNAGRPTSHKTYAKKVYAMHTRIQKERIAEKGKK